MTGSGARKRAGLLGTVARLALPGLIAAVLVTGASSEAFAFKLFGYGFFEDEEKPASPDAQPYTVDVTVTSPDRDLTSSLRGASQLYSDKDGTPPPSTAAFLSKARAEYERLLAALYAGGYYGGSIAITVGGKPLEQIAPDATLPHPVAVAISVDPGPAFTFGSIVTKGRAPDDGSADNPKIMTPERAGLVPGAPARAESVVKAEQAMVDAWRRLGHPKAVALPRQATADHKTDRLDVAIAVASGPAAVFGPVAVTGTKDMDPDFVARQTGLVPGQPYSPEELERAMRRLRRLQVFSSTRLVEADEVTPDGTLPITVEVAERPLHVFGGGASWSSLDGIGLEGYWEHRNLFGQAERLRLEARMSGIDSVDPSKFTYFGGVTFTKPGILDPFTDLTVALSAGREVYDPYWQNTYRARLGLVHEFSERLTGKIALNGEFDQVQDAFEYSPLTKDFGTRELVFISTPGEIAYDGSDDKLEPTRGWRAKLQLEPFYEAKLGNAGVITRLDGSAYYSLDGQGRFVLAGRAALGSILGAGADEMPADRLFFAGGGGSVRGYDYRSLGPHIDVGTGQMVAGGRSLIESSLELRVKVTDTIGVVPFVDAGGAFSPSYPDFSEPLKVGAGLGLRYYTSIGAIRADFAMPVNPDKGDSRFAFYIGIGEAF